MSGPREFRVWAPIPDSVSLVHGDTTTAMEREAGGWWQAWVEWPDPSEGYGFLVDGEGPFPDPRARWQPRGVHGLSRVADPDGFEWRHPDFRAPPLASAVIHELHVGTFTPEGTFDAAASRLDHLVDLGVTHVELMPVAQFPGARGWGYDGVHLYAVHDAYGGPDGLRRFVDACHGAGLAVLLDVVYNHLGPEGNYLGRFGPYFTDAYRTPWGEAINLDGPGSDEVRRFLVENACMWLEEYRIDGLRLDAVHAFFDRSATHFLEELSESVRRLGRRLARPLVLIAESDLNDPRVVTPVEAGGLGMDAQWSDDFHHALHALLTGEQDGYYADFGALADVVTALERGFVHAGDYSKHRERRHGRAFRELRPSRLLGYLQNHDQVGNRARGDRITSLASPGRVRIGAALVLLGPFVPLLFQGEAWGATAPFLYFTDLTDPELGKAVSEGRRGEFGAFGWAPEDVPDPQDPSSFRRSVLDWDEPGSPPHADLLAWYRRLVALRRNHPDLADDRMPRVRTDEPREHWLVMERGRIALWCNVGSEPCRIPLDPGTAEGLEILMDYPEGCARVHADAVEVPPDGVAVTLLRG
ncbi:MAG: malto-oligosyltrehalose trehalohydrolase [Gemmatimonadales bacterium]|nr:MAG: malto-oligosyltrehalose trehalohydrolase [Gemmatimonadales bacterium]